MSLNHSKTESFTVEVRAILMKDVEMKPKVVVMQISGKKI